MGRKSKQRKPQLELQNQETKGQTMSDTIPIARVLSDPKEVPGVMTMMMKHHIIKTEADITFTGPKISKTVWNEVLAYFKWVYDTSHSECQVRLYVNPTQGCWAAWAYPQEAKTGMSAKEIVNEQSELQRQQFKSSDGWIYWGTVHHHCACGAFQSGTDENNEKTQEGIHITIGHLNDPVYDLDARLYIRGIKFPVNMEWFWGIGDALDLIPTWMKRSLPDKPGNLIAREQMCVPPPADTTFPQQWKDNLIAIPVVVATTTSSGGFQYDGGMGVGRPYRRLLTKRLSVTSFDKNKAVDDLLHWKESLPDNLKLDDGELMTRLKILAQSLDNHDLDILDMLQWRDVTPMVVYNHIIDMEEEQAKKELEQEAKAVTNGSGTGHAPRTEKELEDAMDDYYTSLGRGGLPE